MVEKPTENQCSLILASASPRRHQLLAGAGMKFRVVESRIPEETRDGESAGGFAVRMAQEKALAVSRWFPDELVLAADTVVELNGRILGKPADANEARVMLKSLAGRTHVVTTAFAIARARAILESACVSSRVTFRTLSDAEIESYVQTDEPFDKAGSYGIQGQGAGFIIRVEGSRDNVMGLPTREVLDALSRCGLRSSRAEP